MIKRLSLYSRILQSFEFQGIEKISSAEVARRLGLNSAQVRKDLACFGQFGIPGFGYHVNDLRKQVRGILKTDREMRVILVGVGNLGTALLSYRGFLKQGFTMLFGFDVNPRSAEGRTRSNVPIYDIRDLESKIEGQRIDIAVLAVPVEVAQEVTNRLVKCGVLAILNFVPMRIEVPAHIQVRYVDFSLELESLAYYVQDREKAKRE
ncbi:redox-sensing transcriptional repressor Rex [Candidatus Sumerlaeota bacterium]|nr:redox-sensing transcriptional repressor Rex [Candidatus Sumerlaeota bacterium]